jgi:hypothetical protein
MSGGSAQVRAQFPHASAQAFSQQGPQGRTVLVADFEA